MLQPCFQPAPQLQPDFLFPVPKLQRDAERCREMQLHGQGMQKAGRRDPDDRHPHERDTLTRYEQDQDRSEQAAPRHTSRLGTVCWRGREAFSVCERLHRQSMGLDNRRAKTMATVDGMGPDATPTRAGRQERHAAVDQ